MTYITPGQNTRPFTDTLRSQLLQELGGQHVERILGYIGGKLATAVVPVLIDVGAGQSSGARQGDPFAALSTVPETLRADAARAWMDERRAAQDWAAAERAWTQTPFYRFLASGDQRDLLTNDQQFINDNLLRPT